MYITPPIQVTGANFVLPSPRPSSGAAPVAIQISNNSSWVIGFNNGSQEFYIDPYTRTTVELATVTDAIPATPVYQAYSLVGAGYVAADWLIDGENPSQPDGSLPISQLITQAIQSLTSVDDSVTISDPNGPTADLSVTGYKNLPQGYLASVIGPASAIGIDATVTNFLSLTTNVQANRHYRINVFALGQQSVATGNGYFNLNGPIDSGTGRFVQQESISATYYLTGGAVFLYSPTAAGSQTWTLQGYVTSGTLTVGANTSFIFVEDIGV